MAHRRQTTLSRSASHALWAFIALEVQKKTKVIGTKEIRFFVQKTQQPLIRAKEINQLVCAMLVITKAMAVSVLRAQPADSILMLAALTMSVQMCAHLTVHQLLGPGRR